MVTIIRNCADKIRHFYARPIRKGAMMSWDEAKRFYWITFLGYPIIVALFIGLLMQDSLDFQGTISLILFGGLTFGGTALIGLFYGYHHRDQIDTRDEVAMDSRGVYWGAAAAALVPAIYRWIERFFSG